MRRAPLPLNLVKLYSVFVLLSCPLKSRKLCKFWCVGVGGRGWFVCASVSRTWGRFVRITYGTSTARVVSGLFLSFLW